jgi:phenylpropionate dioxygenase-like ring-hydroxylating dioxygenase large terminal subunit
VEVSASDAGEIVKDVPVGLDGGLPNYWYPVLQSEEVAADQPHAFRVMGRELVAWRDGDGAPRVVLDRCPHRGAKLSIGLVLDGGIQCPLHGIRFDGEGACTRIPWEPDDSPLLDTITTTAYPTRELGGYIWSYLGDAGRFPPPPLEDEVPEELSHTDRFICFRLPTDYWKTNWLVAIDGGDAYHAVILHAESQAVSRDAWTGGGAREANVPVAERRLKIVQTEHGIRAIALDAAGEQVHHGHFTNQRMLGDRFVLPCITSNPIRPVPGVEPYTARLWQYPVDENLTRIERFFCFRAENDEQRETATRVFNEVALPRIERVGAEDKLVAESQGDLMSARANEVLFSPDVDLVKLRRQIRDAFLSARAGKRVDVHSDSLVFPV